MTTLKTLTRIFYDGTKESVEGVEQILKRGYEPSDYSLHHQKGYVLEIHHYYSQRYYEWLEPGDSMVSNGKTWWVERRHAFRKETAAHGS